MKKLLVCLAGLLTATMLTACPIEPTDHQAHLPGLRLHVEAGSVTPAGLRLSTINDTGQYFGHGVDFRIERRLGPLWTQVPFINDNFAWISLLVIVNPHSVEDENISWRHMHGELSPGQYRIVRKITGEDFSDPTPRWEQDRPEAYLYAVFTVEEDWQAAHEMWQVSQDEIAAARFARYDGLDLEILEYSPRGLAFTLTNNNLSYSYIINSVFVGWEDIFPDGGMSGSVELDIYSQMFPGDLWPFGDNKRLSPGEHLLLEVDWHDERGNLTASMTRQSPNPYLFDLVVDVALDVDEDYIRENFSHIIPWLPAEGHRIRAHFDLSP